MEYPLFEKIKERLEELSQSQEWLANKMGISKRTLYNYKSIMELSLEHILNLSKNLDFDFMEDLNSWRLRHDEPIISRVSDVSEPYKTEPKLTMQISLLTKAANATAVLEAVEKLGEKLGFEIK